MSTKDKRPCPIDGCKRTRQSNHSDYHQRHPNGICSSHARTFIINLRRDHGLDYESPSYECLTCKSMGQIKIIGLVLKSKNACHRCSNINHNVLAVPLVSADASSAPASAPTPESTDNEISSTETDSHAAPSDQDIQIPPQVNEGDGGPGGGPDDGSGGEPGGGSGDEASFNPNLIFSGDSVEEEDLAMGLEYASGEPSGGSGGGPDDTSGEGPGGGPGGEPGGGSGDEASFNPNLIFSGDSVEEEDLAMGLEYASLRIMIDLADNKTSSTETDSHATPLDQDNQIPPQVDEGDDDYSSDKGKQDFLSQSESFEPLFDLGEKEDLAINSENASLSISKIMPQPEDAMTVVTGKSQTSSASSLLSQLIGLVKSLETLSVSNSSKNSSNSSSKPPKKKARMGNKGMVFDIKSQAHDTMCDHEVIYELPNGAQIVDGHVDVPSDWTFIAWVDFDLEAFKKNEEATDIVSCMGRSFNHCFDLVSVSMPNSVTSIGDGAFYECSSLETVSIGNSVTSIGSSAFKACSILETVCHEHW